jgi:hypothetical protein
MIGVPAKPRISRPCYDRQPPLIQIKQIPDTRSFYRMEGRFPRAGLWVKTAGASPQGEGAGFIGAVVGAIIVLVIYGFVAGRRRAV